LKQTGSREGDPVCSDDLPIREKVLRNSEPFAILDKMDRMVLCGEDMTDEERSYLRFYVAQLVRIWTALSIIRKGKAPELLQVFRDLCSDKLRVMLYEFKDKKSWKLGFAPNGNPKHDHFYARLVEANKWFEGYKNGLHARNCSGAHMQPLDRADHMFQHFGHGGEREWKHLTKGVAACLAMMRIVDGKPHRDFWRKIRAKVRGTVCDEAPETVGGEQMMVSLPIGVEALLQSFTLDDAEF
jgi:hypothetical protein